MNWYLGVLNKYGVFYGRARRKEYWMFYLFNLIVFFVMGVIDGIFGGSGMIVSLYGLAVLLPSIAVSVRRLHDIDRIGWWLLLIFVPIIGGLVLLFFSVQDSTPGENKYGANPKEAIA